MTSVGGQYSIIPLEKKIKRFGEPADFTFFLQGLTARSIKQQICSKNGQVSSNFMAAKSVKLHVGAILLQQKQSR